MPKKINNEWIFSDKELDEMIDRAEDLHEKYVKDKPTATKYVFDSKERIISIRVSDGIRIDFPVWKIKELRKASNEEIKKAYITKAGDAIHWDNLDAHYTVAGLVANIFGTREWMRELAKIGGSVSSDAKAKAARSNGQKGGRPPLASSRSTTASPIRRSAVGQPHRSPPARGGVAAASGDEVVGESSASTKTRSAHSNSFTKTSSRKK